MGEFLRELRRRKVLQVIGIYLVLTILTIDIVDVLITLRSWPEWMLTVLAGLAVLLLPVVVVLAWAYEVTPDGIRPVQIMPDPEAGPEHGARRLEIVFALLIMTAIAWIAFRNAYLIA